MAGFHGTWPLHRSIPWSRRGRPAGTRTIRLPGRSTACDCGLRTESGKTKDGDGRGRNGLERYSGRAASRGPTGRSEHHSGKALPGMKLEQFFRHHGIVGNPFSEEDAARRTCSSGDAWRRSTTPRGTSSSASPADPCRRPWSSARKERQDGPATPGQLRVRGVQSVESGRAGLRHLVRRFQPLPGQLPDGDARTRHEPGPRELAAQGPHGRGPVAGRHAPDRPADQREG